MDFWFSPCEDPPLLPLLPRLCQWDEHLLHGLNGLHRSPVVRVDPLDLLPRLMFVGGSSLLHSAGVRHGLKGGPILQNLQAGLGKLLRSSYVVPADVGGRRQPETLGAVDRFPRGLADERAVGREAVQQVQERRPRTPFQVLQVRFPGHLFMQERRKVASCPCSPCMEVEDRQQEERRAEQRPAVCPLDHLAKGWNTKHTRTRSIA